MNFKTRRTYITKVLMDDVHAEMGKQVAKNFGWKSLQNLIPYRKRLNRGTVSSFKWHSSFSKFDSMKEEV